MAHSIEVPTTSSVDQESVPKSTNVDYSFMLKAFDLEYSSQGYYWQVGKLREIQGWVINLSVVRPQMEDLLRLILPVLVEKQVAFKIIRDRLLADTMLEGQLGSFYLGKLICMYPESEEDAVVLAKQIILLTKDFNGPAILTDRRLGAIAFTSYGPFKDTLHKETGAQHRSLPHINWPFAELTAAISPKRPKLLNGKYYPISVIKKDAKGDVSSALYFKNLWTIKSCIIKQGRKNILYDDNHRDIRDRLKWQYDLYQELSNDISLPRVFDYFEEEGDAYLVMDFIRGISVTELLQNSFKEAPWFDLKGSVQQRIIGSLLQIVDIVQRLHNKGYVHRDITPENFIIDKENRYWLIDIELMFSLNLHIPDPAFPLGTPGFMSPEQLRTEIPTTKEDIYALGALMLTAFTNLPPTKFEVAQPEKLKKNLFHFIRNNVLVELVADCLSSSASDRPDLHKIRLVLESYQQNAGIASSLGLTNIEKFLADQNFKLLSTAIQNSLNGLSHPEFLSPDLQWFSRMTSEETRFGNEQVGTVVCEGWHKGLSGPIWLISLAKSNGFAVEKLMDAYDSSCRYIKRSYFNRKKIDASLYSGGAGIALAFSEAFERSLLCDECRHVSLEMCFSMEVLDLTLSGGISGQGIALLRAAHLMPSHTVKEYLSRYVGELVDRQKGDGSWILESDKNRKGKYDLTLASGTPGIIWFLLHYIEQGGEIDIRAMLARALNSLIKIAWQPKQKVYYWPFGNLGHSSVNWNTDHGIAGIALVFIKAFEVLGNETYKEIALSHLNTLPPRPILTNFTLAHGLAGIGEVYLEAYRVFKTEEWKIRTEWISQFFLHSSHCRPSGEMYWKVENESDATADLFTGNSGIIHFLMRYLLPEKLSHPLAVNSNNRPGFKV